MDAIEAHGLCKRFGRVAAVDSLDLQIQEGTVFGLLGANGAGKTTTIRLLLGLLRPDRGEARILGQRIRAEVGPPRIVGALVERPAFYPYLSGRDNLNVFAASSGLSGRAKGQRVGSLLDLVRLAPAADRAVRGYSAGMRARLAIALALLADPRVLIVDEPANALDPEGVADVRTLLGGLARQGRTILLSSHLLAEIERLCDEVAVMDHGRIVAAGKLDELLRGTSRVVVRFASDSEAAVAARRLAQAGFSTQSSVADDGRLKVAHEATDVPHVSRAILRVLAADDLYPIEVRLETPSLEDAFLALTGPKANARSSLGAQTAGPR